MRPTSRFPSSSLARRVMLQSVLPLAALQSVSRPPAAIAAAPSFFERLRARYILLRPGETSFEAAGMVDSNPINKGQAERGLTAKGREQVLRSADEMRKAGITSPVIFYDNGVRATQTADILGQALGVPRRDIEPEFRWLEARGLGALDGTDLREAVTKLRAMDTLDIDNAPEPSDDGTPADSVNEVYSRMGNTIRKIESTYGAGDFVVVGGDATVLSVFAAAACGADLREHSKFELPPGSWYDLRELVRSYKEGTFTPAERIPSWLPSDQEAKRGRDVINDMGEGVFSESAAGSCLCCECFR